MLEFVRPISALDTHSLWDLYKWKINKKPGLDVDTLWSKLTKMKKKIAEEKILNFNGHLFDNKGLLS